MATTDEIIKQNKIDFLFEIKNINDIFKTSEFTCQLDNFKHGNIVQMIDHQSLLHTDQELINFIKVVI